MAALGTDLIWHNHMGPGQVCVTQSVWLFKPVFKCRTRVCQHTALTWLLGHGFSTRIHITCAYLCFIPASSCAGQSLWRYWHSILGKGHFCCFTQTGGGKPCLTQPSFIQKFTSCYFQEAGNSCFLCLSFHANTTGGVDIKPILRTGLLALKKQKYQRHYYEARGNGAKTEVQMVKCAKSSSTLEMIEASAFCFLLFKAVCYCVRSF